MRKITLGIVQVRKKKNTKNGFSTCTNQFDHSKARKTLTPPNKSKISELEL